MDKIKTPVFKHPLGKGSYQIRDKDNAAILWPYSEAEADQMVTALNAQQPCGTCGGSEEVLHSCSPGTVIGALGKKPCPDCQPGELAKSLRKLVGQIRNAKQLPLIFAMPEDVELLEQAAARISQLENLLEKHKHTDECLAYAAKTVKASGNYYCIAECADSRKAALGEEGKDGT